MEIETKIGTTGVQVTRKSTHRRVGEQSDGHVIGDMISIRYCRRTFIFRS